MSDRISRVTTRTGDTGTTGTATGNRLPKTDPLFAVIGDVDELNSSLGLTIAAVEQPPAEIIEVQQQLFEVGSFLALEGQGTVPDTTTIEQASERWNAALPPLKEFVLPGGCEAAARCHMARTICRRAERSAWQLESNYAPVGQYLNRLSDLLFVWARILNQETGTPEPTWRGPGG